MVSAFRGSAVALMYMELCAGHYRGASTYSYYYDGLANQREPIRLTISRSYHYSCTLCVHMECFVQDQVKEREGKELAWTLNLFLPSNSALEHGNELLLLCQ